MQLLLASLLTFARPTEGNLHLQSTQGYPFWVHASSAHASVASGVRDLLDEFWRAEIDHDGWQAPLPDEAGPDSGFDVYIDASLGLGEAYVDGETRQPGTSKMSAYMALPAQWESPSQMRSFVAHELNHASQYAMNCDMDDAFFEHTAVWVEARAAFAASEWSVGVEPFQSHSERALTYIKSDEYEYGAALWLMYFTQDASLLQQLWLGGTNYFATLDQLIAQPRSEFFAAFSAWRATAPLPIWPDERKPTGEKLEASLGMYGAAYWRMHSPPERLYPARGSQAQLALVAVDAAGQVLDTAINPSEWHRPEHTASVLIALTRATDNYDPSTQDFTTRKVHATLAQSAALVGIRGDALGGDPDTTLVSTNSAPLQQSGCASVPPSLFLLVLCTLGRAGARWATSQARLARNG